MAYVYIVECGDGTLYTGWTTDLKSRVETHNRGKGASYTRGRGPVRIAYWEAADDKRQAQRREAAIKKLTRQDKLKLISQTSMEKLPE